MISAGDAAALNTVGLLLLLCFSLSLVAVGLLLAKAGLWDKGRKTGTSRRGGSGSAAAGKLLIAAGAVLFCVSLLFLIVNAAVGF